MIENQSPILEVLEAEKLADEETAKYVKRIKKLKKKIKKLKKKNNLLRDEAEECTNQLKKEKKRNKKLKRTIQLERYEVGRNPFLSNKTYKKFKKQLKASGKCTSGYTSFPMLESRGYGNSYPVIDAEFREVGEYDAI